MERGGPGRAHARTAPASVAAEPRPREISMENTPSLVNAPWPPRRVPKASCERAHLLDSRPESDSPATFSTARGPSALPQPGCQSRVRKIITDADAKPPPVRPPLLVIPETECTNTVEPALIFCGCRCPLLPGRVATLGSHLASAVCAGQHATN